MKGYNGTKRKKYQSYLNRMKEMSLDKSSFDQLKGILDIIVTETSINDAVKLQYFEAFEAVLNEITLAASEYSDEDEYREEVEEKILTLESIVDSPEISRLFNYVEGLPNNIDPR